MKRALDALKRERLLAMVGVLSIAMGIFCLIYGLLLENKIGQEGDLFKAVSFDLALGIFILTIALIVPYAKIGNVGIYIFRRLLFLLALYSLLLETIQHFRGFDPRFTQVGSDTDKLLGTIFAFVAVTLVLVFIFLFIRVLLVRTVIEQEKNIVLAIKYGLFTTLISFAAGIWISVLQSRYTGDSGNIIWVHGLGFHGVQSIPLVALLVNASLRKNLSWVIHLSGIVYTLLVVVVGMQAYEGLSLFKPSLYLFLAVLFSFVYCGLFIYVGILSLQVRKNTNSVRLSL
ncbi:hypothetical protein CJ195_12075 [Bacillus sp. UMB0899]|nr:hypothetical protein CJ195_12075 [Bacillus sp. UMB0899]